MANSRSQRPLVTVAVTVVLLMLLFMSQRSTVAASQRQFINAMRAHSSEPDAEAAIRDAWELAQVSGAYRFTADVVQTSTPVATILNAGRQGKRQSMYIEGETICTRSNSC